MRKLKEIIRGGESETLEFKERFNTDVIADLPDAKRCK